VGRKPFLGARGGHKESLGAYEVDAVALQPTEDARTERRDRRPQLDDVLMRRRAARSISASRAVADIVRGAAGFARVFPRAIGQPAISSRAASAAACIRAAKSASARLASIGRRRRRGNQHRSRSTRTRPSSIARSASSGARCSTSSSSATSTSRPIWRRRRSAKAEAAVGRSSSSATRRSTSDPGPSSPRATEP